MDINQNQYLMYKESFERSISVISIIYQSSPPQNLWYNEKWNNEYG